MRDVCDNIGLVLCSHVLCRSYMQYLCEEINDIIQEEGQASVADLSKNYNLPINFLMQVYDLSVVKIL